MGSLRKPAMLASRCGREPDTGADDSSRSDRSRVWAFSLVLACVVMLPMVGGCGGCGGAKKKPAAKKKPEEVTKPNYEQSRLSTDPGTDERVESFVKPGHWTSASLEVVANNFNFNGQLVTQPFVLPGTDYRMGTVRPALLPKGQKKQLGMTFLVPALSQSVARPSLISEQKNISVWLQNRAAANIARARYPNTLMPPHQYTLVVLCRDPERYTQLQRRDCMRSIIPFDPRSDGTDLLRTCCYRVQLPSLEGRVSLPDGPLAWTSIAYVVWDDVEPNRLTERQQGALLDWLHWGGQLAISGPASLDLLGGSFLEPYLPVTNEGSVDLSADDFDDVVKDFGNEKNEDGFRFERTLSGQALGVANGGRLLAGTEERPLVVERSVGRGRVVVSAFRLGEAVLWNWGGFDSFFNAAIMRRAPRHFISTPDGMHIDVERVGETQPARRNMEFGGVWDAYPDPRFVTDVRYFSRDADNDVASRVPNDRDDFEFEERYRHRTSPAAWDNNNVAAVSARESLSDAAGIAVPDSGFVVRMLVVYLIALVPVNWLVFRLIGRVEWAWFAAPVISIGFAVAVTRMAQLDIGFVRAQTDVNIVEVQSGYDRAHVTRYTALYASLSTIYDLEFEDASAVAAPLPLAGDAGDGGQTIQFFPGEQPALRGFRVASNSIGLLHSEQMMPLGGTISLERAESGELVVVNGTQLTIEGAGVVGDGRRAWIGRLEPGSRAVLEFEAAESGEAADAGVDAEAVMLSQVGLGNGNGGSGVTTVEPGISEEAGRGAWPLERSESPLTSTRLDRKYIQVRTLTNLAESTVDEGELRLVGWSDESIDGMAIRPAPSQRRTSSVVVVHLTYPEAEAPETDVNRVETVRAKLTEGTPF